MPAEGDTCNEVPTIETSYDYVTDIATYPVGSKVAGELA